MILSAAALFLASRSAFSVSSSCSFCSDIPYKRPNSPINNSRSLLESLLHWRNKIHATLVKGRSRCLAEFRAAARNKFKSIFRGNRIFAKNTSHGANGDLPRGASEAQSFRGQIYLPASIKSIAALSVVLILFHLLSMRFGKIDLLPVQIVFFAISCLSISNSNRPVNAKLNAMRLWLPPCTRLPGKVAETQKIRHCEGQSSHPKGLSSRRWRGNPFSFAMPYMRRKAPGLSEGNLWY